MIFGLFALFVALGGLSQSLWWTSPQLVQNHGLGWVVITVVLGVLLVCGLLFQAERLLAYTYNPLAISESATLYPPVHSYLLRVFLLSAFVGALLLASHHLLVSAWQLNINYNLVHQANLFPNVELVIANQAELKGGLEHQLAGLVVVSAGVLLVLLVACLQPAFLLALLVLVLGMLGVFTYAFVQLVSVTELSLPPNSFAPLPSLRLVFESSLVGFGVVLGLCRWQGLAARPGWLVSALLLLACGYGVSITAAWVFARFSWIDSQPDSGRLLLHLPYFFSQAGHWMGWLWLALCAILAWVKLALLLSFGTLVASRLLYHSPASSSISMLFFCAFLSLSWMLIAWFFQPVHGQAAELLFDVLFNSLLTYWYPLHIALLCLLALLQPAEEHAIYMYRQSYWLGWVMRHAYLVLLVWVLWYAYQLI